jgi:hypothetical protein
MTRTAIRYTLSALAALALVSAFAATPASAQMQLSTNLELGLERLDTKKGPAKEAAEAQKYTADQQSGAKVKTPKGFATKKGLQHAPGYTKYTPSYGGGKY